MAAEEMDFTVKRLTPEHAPDWLRLRIEGVQKFPEGFLLTVEEASSITRERAEELLAPGETRGLFHQGTLIGFCGCFRMKLQRISHRAEVGPFYVTPGYHGTKAASFLMSAIIEEARSDGIAQLELFVAAENARAIRFYEKSGFQKVGTHPDSVRVDGVSYDDHFYCLRLKPTAS